MIILIGTDLSPLSMITTEQKKKESKQFVLVALVKVWKSHASGLHYSIDMFLISHMVHRRWIAVRHFCSKMRK